MEKHARAMQLTIESSALQLANHPTVGLYYIRDHIRQSTPAMMKCKIDLDNCLRDIQLGTYDVETDLASVNDMKSVANSTFKKLEDLLDTALEDARQLHAAETKARGSSSSLKRFLGRR